LKSQASLWPVKFRFPKKSEMISSVQSIENYFIQIAFLLYDDILERNQDLFGNFSFVLNIAVLQPFMGSVLISLIKTKEGGPQWATTRLQGVQLDLKNDTGSALFRYRSSIAYDFYDMSHVNCMLSKSAKNLELS